MERKDVLKSGNSQGGKASSAVAGKRAAELSFIPPEAVKPSSLIAHRHSDDSIAYASTDAATADLLLQGGRKAGVAISDKKMDDEQPSTAVTANQDVVGSLAAQIDWKSLNNEIFSKDATIISISAAPPPDLSEYQTESAAASSSNSSSGTPSPQKYRYNPPKPPRLAPQPPPVTIYDALSALSPLQASFNEGDPLSDPFPFQQFDSNAEKEEQQRCDSPRMRNTTILGFIQSILHAQDAV